MKKSIILLFSMSISLLSGCNSGTTANTAQNSLLSNVALTTKSNVNIQKLYAQINAKAKSNDAIKFNYTLDGQPFDDGILSWRDMGWHLLTLTVTSVPNGAGPVPVNGVIAIAGNPTNNPYGENATINDINCGSAIFAKVGDTCSVYLKAGYNVTEYPNVNPNIKVYIWPGNSGVLSHAIAPTDYIVSKSKAAIYRPIHAFETKYYDGSMVSESPSQYRMLLMENSGIESISINNITAPSNVAFTQLHRTTSGLNDPVYGKWNECSLIANSGLNQVSTLASLNSSCIIVYQVAATSTLLTQSSYVTLGTNANIVFPPKAGSYNLQANYSGIGLSWNPSQLSNIDSGSSPSYILASGNGMFLAIPSSVDPVPPFAYTNDGVTWNEPANNFPEDAWGGVSYGNGTFVLVSGDGYENPNGFTTAYSSDGIKWTTSNQLPISFPGSIAFGDNKFVVTGGANAAYSSDGINWKKTPLPSSQQYWNMVYGNNTFVAVSESVVAYSSDGINWKQAPLPSSHNWEIIYGNNQFMAVAAATDKVLYSSDGINWSPSQLSFTSMPSDDWVFGYGNGEFLAAQKYGNVLEYSLDGKKWHKSASPGTGGISGMSCLNNECLLISASVGLVDTYYGVESPYNLASFTINLNNN